MTKAEAHKLSGMIRAYWRSLELTAEAHVIHDGSGNYDVVTNLQNGLPPGVDGAEVARRLKDMDKRKMRARMGDAY